MIYEVVTGFSHCSYIFSPYFFLETFLDSFSLDEYYAYCRDNFIELFYPLVLFMFIFVIFKIPFCIKKNGLMTGEIRARRRRQQNDSQSGRDAALLATVSQSHHGLLYFFMVTHQTGSPLNNQI